MSKLVPLLAAAAVTAGVPAAAAPPAARLTRAQAQAIALHRAPGRIQDAEYEREGSGWRYSFDIVQGSRIHEIGVDANTGRIVEDKYEGRHDPD